MGLKVFQHSETLSENLIVEIRPRWDWKGGNTPDSSFVLYVEIRPRWDWKDFGYMSLEELLNQLKSDQDGIESWTSRLDLLKNFALKSDQDGIERN